MRNYAPYRVASTVLGLTCAGLGSYGAFEFVYKLEGTMSYLVIAAPVVAVTAALIPPIAEATWRAGGYVKALLWWTVLVPTGALVFFSAAERVCDAKAGAEAERGALRGAASRAEATLARTEAELVKATAEANSARGQKQCGPACRTKLAAQETAKADVDAARLALLQAERKATTESPLKAPAWLLPAALDLAAFMGIWTALSGPKKVPMEVPQGNSKARARRRRRRATPASRQQRAANANGVYLPAAE
jgi:hypothetical protein